MIMANNKTHLLLHILLYIQAMYTVYSQLILLEPESLANQFPARKVTGSTAAFGTPFYGRRLLGILEFFDTTGCRESDYNFTLSHVSTGESADHEHNEKGGLRKIAMLRRGECHFVNKVDIAETKGSTAVVIVDTQGSKTTAEDVSKVIMADDGWGDAVKIPSLLIGELDGNKLIEALKNDTVIVELAWSLPKSTTVQVDQWQSPSFQDTNQFLANFAPYAKKFKHKLDYRPHYVILSLPGDFKDMCSDESGKYCAWDPDNGGKTTGRHIVEETVRQVCLWEMNKKLNEADMHPGFKSEKWWNYVERFVKECPPRGLGNKKFERRDEAYISAHSIGAECSYDIMKEVGADIEEVKKCYENDFYSILNDEINNKAWALDAITINGWRYSGPLEAEKFARTLCTGFHRVPEECTEMFGSTFEADMSLEGVGGRSGKKAHHSTQVFRGVYFFPLWSLVFISCLSAFIIFLLFLGFIYCCCMRKNAKRNLDYAIMDEIQRKNKEVTPADYDGTNINNRNNFMMATAPFKNQVEIGSLPGTPILPPHINMTDVSTSTTTAATPLGKQFKE